LTDIPITGPGIIPCTTPAQYTTLPDLLDVNYNWSVSPGLQIISGQGTATVTISGLPNNQYGSGILTLTLSSPTKGRIRTYTVSKNITIYTGVNISGTYNSPTNSAEPLVHYYTPPKQFPTQWNSACIAFVTNLSVPSNTTVTWSGSGDPGVYWYQTGKNIFCSFSAVGQTAGFRVYVTNSCGTSEESYTFKCTTMASCGVTPQFSGGGEIMLSPNPANNNITVSLKDKTESIQKITAESTQRAIKEIRIVDKMGNVKQTSNYAGTINNISLNVSSLKADVYTIQVFDGQSWYSEKFIKN
jgi:hypothetical protein